MLYHISQGFRGLLQAKFSTLFAIIIITLSLIVITIFLLFIINTQRLVDSIHERMELEVFIDNSVDSVAVNSINMAIQQIEGLKDIRYVSREEAAEYFKSQFDENIFDILDHNPLPASFRMKLDKEFRRSDKVNLILVQLRSIDGVDDVVFRQDLLMILEKYLGIAFIFILILGGILAFGSIYLVSNTIKFLVQGIIQGFLGAIVAIMLLFITMKFIDIEIPNLIIMPTNFYWLILGLGIVFGLLGSVLAMNKFIKY